MLFDKTIAAISTAISSSGIGIIRISGPDAFCVIDQVYKSKNGKKKISDQLSHTIHYGYIVEEDEVLDEVLVSIMRAPNTYTGEDTIEINCHGGVFLLNQVLELILKKGAYPAEPGEFTKRAFMNGKLDLSQAEAVMDVIDSKNDYALKTSVSQLKGNIKNIINELRNKIIYHTAFIESALDDPEHISLDGYNEELLKDMNHLKMKLESLIQSFNDGKIMKEGIQTVIIGKPNVGKSSLLNLLAGDEKAIVTEIEGTTRDVLEETINIGGITLNIMDTAGIRSTEDVVEKIGVNKAKEFADKADLIIYIVDSSRKIDENDEEIIQLVKDKKLIVLLNKIDLKSEVEEEDIYKMIHSEVDIIPISAKNETGIDILSDTIKKMFIEGTIDFNDQVYISNARQKKELQISKDSLSRVIDSIENGMPEDFYSIDLMDAYEALGKIVGETVGEDLINEIFSKFCMGK